MAGGNCLCRTHLDLKWVVATDSDSHPRIKKNGWGFMKARFKPSFETCFGLVRVLFWKHPPTESCNQVCPARALDVEA